MSPRLGGATGWQKSCRPAAKVSDVVKRVVGDRSREPEHHYFGDLVRDGPLKAEARPPY
jgi:hypothetical protein